MHQLHEREAAAAVQSHHVRVGAGGVQARGPRVEVHRLRTRPPADHRSHRETDGHLVTARRRVPVPQSHRPHLLRQAARLALAASQVRQAELQVHIRLQHHSLCRQGRRFVCLFVCHFDTC